MYHLVVNPTAGKGKALRLIDGIQEAFEKRNVEYAIHMTKSPGHATDIARELVSSGAKIIIAVGGDGTVAEVGKGLIGTDAALGIIPAGTGNDYRKSFDIPDNTDDAVECILHGKAMPYDAFKINDETYLNIASVGFDVDVLGRAMHYKIFGSAAYTLGAIEGAFFAKKYPTKITIDDKVIEKDILLLALGCGTHYGGGMNPLPTAKKTDGLMEVCLIEPVNTIRILNLLPKYVVGKHPELEEVTMYTAKEVLIDFKGAKLKINADGDILPAADKLHAKILPRAINIIRL